MKYQPYPRYKPSLPAEGPAKAGGVEWLGDVPEHWEVKRLRHVLSRNDGGVWGEEDDPEGTVVLRSTEQTVDGSWQISDPAKRNLTPKEKSVALLKAGDLVVTKSSGSALHIGKTSLVSKEVEALQPCYSNFMQRLRVASGFDPRLVFYVLNSPTGRQQLVFNSNTTTGLANLNAGVLGDVFISTPPPAEQRAIAAFLDRETGRVDRLVAKKRELIERLKEKRTALISRTVTRGLPPAAARAAGLPANPPLKPSALDWLGDIPKHWEIKPVKFVARIGNGSTPSRDNPTFWEEGDYPWLNSSVVNQETITEAEEFVTSVALRECHLPKVKPPAVLIGITGQGRTRGMASTLMFEATINQHVAYLKPFPSRAGVGFLRRVFDMVYLFLRSESDGGGSTKGAITCEQIANLKIPIPPLPEQAAIAAYLDLETAKLDALVGKVELAVERLQEYRTALITAAVTGKIDVRKAVADA